MLLVTPVQRPQFVDCWSTACCIHSPMTSVPVCSTLAVHWLPPPQQRGQSMNLPLPYLLLRFSQTFAHGSCWLCFMAWQIERESLLLYTHSRRKLIRQKLLGAECERLCTQYWNLERILDRAFLPFLVNLFNGTKTALATLIVSPRNVTIWCARQSIGLQPANSHFSHIT